MTQDHRISRLNGLSIKDGKYVLYWMQQSQRVHYNHALLRASYWALNLDLPLVVFFGLKEDYPEANQRHFRFMLEGLSEVHEDLHQLGIKFVLRNLSPEDGAAELSKDASITICDMGYLRHQRMWREQLASKIQCPLEMVEADVVVPVELAYDKEAYSAAVLRPKLRGYLSEHMVIPRELWPEKDSIDIGIEGLDPRYPDRILKEMDIDRNVGPVDQLRGGGGEANRKLHSFLKDKIICYSEDRNDPSKGIQSDLSPYLHFGQISPLFIALKTLSEPGPGTDAFLEELIVRRELAMNFTHYNGYYDSFECLPSWARDTLMHHSDDRREYVYSVEDLETASTHDPYWNAAQKQMLVTGKMQNYMRMYWGKKVIEWMEGPSEAFRILLYLNNKYSIDGRDPNSFAGVAWCFGKHDRPWSERPIFGKVRYMNAKGLERKFDMGPYLKRYGG